MDTDPITLNDSTTERAFIDLVLGLNLYAEKGKLAIPDSLRRALNVLAYALPDSFPKTLHAFLILCHRPLSEWYPLPLPDDFTQSRPLLEDGCLSDEASEFELMLLERIGKPSAWARDLPQTAIDNLVMVNLLQRLRSSPDLQAAQSLYTDVRSFLIEHSVTSIELMRVKPALFEELRNFYEAVPVLPQDELLVCDHCGLLDWQQSGWRGVKPSFCSDHSDSSPLIHRARNQAGLYRLKRGIHLRTFLPGRLELRLFQLAEELHEVSPEHVILVERYPGLDTYDMRVTFSDGSRWAIDAKDYLSPKRLARHVGSPLFGEGDLAYSRGFYVVPDKRMEEHKYRDRIERVGATLPKNMGIVTVSVFQQQAEQHLKSLAAPRRTKGKKG